MDALKILSRSTKFSHNTKSTTSHVPSSGPSTNPKSVGLYSHTDEGSGFTPSKKRKRNFHFAESSHSLNGLDFFGTGEPSEEPIRSRGYNKDSLETLRIDTSTSNKHVRSHDIKEPRRDLQQCREILKANKVKITKLFDSDIGVDDRVFDQEGKKQKRKAKTTATVEKTTKTKKQNLEIIPQPLTAFQTLRSRYNVSERLVRNLEAQGYQLPTEVQTGSLPLLLEDLDTSNRRKSTNTGTERPSISELYQDIDLLTVAPTGSGKTLAFLIPALEAVYRHRRSDSSLRDPEADEQTSSGPLVIIIAPTKELANQIVNEARKLAMNTGIKVSLVRKGMKLNSSLDDGTAESEDEATRSTGTIVKSHILVSTPGTIIHAMEGASGDLTTLSSVRHLVLDEADVLLDPLFQQQTLQIWDACSNPRLRVSLWSATMGSSIEDLAKLTIDTRWKRLEAEHHALPARPSLVRLVVGLKDSAVPNIHHKLIYSGTEQGKLMAMRQLLRPSESNADSNPTLIPPFLVFTQTIPRAIALHSELLYDIPQEAGGASRIAVLHADLSDTARDRVMSRFRMGEIWVLITTDLLSRGVDFRGINGVVNYDFPNSSAAYVHRVGRTGRAGRQGGVAVTLYAKEDIPYVKSVANVIAASEGQTSTNRSASDAQQWLLRSLPKPSKNDKKKLKSRGVESRRNGIKDENARPGSSKSRISTKSGYERRLESNRRGVIRKNRDAALGAPKRVNPEDDDFEGLSD